MGRTLDAYSEAGINERGVSCSATLSTSYNDDAKAADPTTKHAHKANPEVKNTGIGEYSYAGVILGESATARAYRTKCVSTLGASAQVDAPFSAV